MLVEMHSLRSIGFSALSTAQLAIISLSNGVAATPPTCLNPQVLSCHNSTAQNTCCFNYPGGQVLQTQFWDTNPATGPADHWTIHGLWPDNCNGSYPQYCDEKRQYTNITQILLSYGRTSLLQYMETYWKDDEGQDETFWEHEWGKHGTCYSTLEPSCYVNYTPQEEVVDFFQRTVDLFMELDSYKFLADAGIVPSTTKNYTSAEIMAALNKPRRVNASIQCYDGQLDEIYYFYDVAGTIAQGDFVPQNPVGETSDCPATNVQYLPKNLTSTPVANDTIPPPPFTGHGYVLVESKTAGKEVGCLNNAGKFISAAANTTCAVFTGAASGKGVTLKSSSGACSVAHSAITCASDINTAYFFTDITGNLAHNNGTQFYSTGVPTGSDQTAVYTSKHKTTLGLAWEALSGPGFTG